MSAMHTNTGLDEPVFCTGGNYTVLLRRADLKTVKKKEKYFSVACGKLGLP